MEQIDETHYRLTSGRILDVATGVIGIPDVATDEWTPEDRLELADFMIDQWRRFKHGSTAEGEREEAGVNAAGGFVVISDTDDGTAVLARNGDWLPVDVTSDRLREHARRFSSIGEAWTFLHERPADWWLSAPGARPRVVQA